MVNFRSADDIELRLRSGVFESPDEVLIVDNCSDPERVQTWESDYGVTTIMSAENLGFAAAVNLAVRTSASGSPILLLNPDLVLTAEVLSGLLEALASPAGLDGVAPLLIEPGNRVQVGAAGGPLTLSAVAAYFLMVSHLLPQVRGVFLTRRQLTRGVRADWLCMACLLVDPDSFEKFGPVPEDELVYAEDLAWGTAATSAGARFALQPHLTAVHARGGSGGSNRWVGAFERTLRRRLPGWRGPLAVGCVRVGLGARRILGRRVD